MEPKVIGFLGYDGVTALDVVGPLEAFATAHAAVTAGGGAGYELLVLGLTDAPFRSESGIEIRPHRTLRDAPALDTVIVPGGSGLRRPETNARVAAWIEGQAGRIRRIAAVCTGIYGVAPTGLLDGRRVTTHWRFARDLGERFPRLRIDPDALFLQDGPFYTSAGITAGIDLSLALIEEDHGPAVALSVARELVVYLKRPGGQEQFSEPLRYQTDSTDAFAGLAAWMAGHLRHDLSVEALAERACLGPRHFSRRFKRVFGSTPAAFVEDLRLNEARRRLADPDQTIGSVAASVGFKSADSFRRAFERRFGVAPGDYRGRFGGKKEM